MLYSHNKENNVTDAGYCALQLLIFDNGQATAIYLPKATTSKIIDLMIQKRVIQKNRNYSLKSNNQNRIIHSTITHK